MQTSAWSPTCSLFFSFLYVTSDKPYLFALALLWFLHRPFPSSSRISLSSQAASPRCTVVRWSPLLARSATGAAVRAGPRASRQPDRHHKRRSIVGFGSSILPRASRSPLPSCAPSSAVAGARLLELRGVAAAGKRGIQSTSSTPPRQLLYCCSDRGPRVPATEAHGRAQAKHAGGRS